MDFKDPLPPTGGVGLGWFKVEQLSFSSMGETRLMEVMVNNKRVGILKREGKVYAFAAGCPHAGAPLCEGWLDAQGRIVCPDHKYRFDPANGRNTSGEGYKLFTYPVELRGDEVWVGIMK